MPFLGQAIVVWVTIIVGVMSYFFLVIARQPERSETPTPPPPPPIRRWQPTSTVSRPRYQAPKPAARTIDLPRYDMEHFPTDRWNSPPASA